jgi:hypothetical protein
MNKQFLSLLLLTSFVGTMSAGQFLKTAGQLALGAKPVVGTSELLAEIAARLAKNEEATKAVFKASQVSMPKTTFFSTFGSKVSSLMAKTGSKFAGFGSATVAKISGLGNTGQTAVIATGLGSAGIATHALATADATRNAVRSVGNYMSQVQEFGFPLHHVEVVRTPWYAQAGSAIAGYASAAKAGVVSTVQAYPKSAIAAGVVATGVLGYLAYNKMFSSNSISLNEQGKVSLRAAVAEAKGLPGGSQVWSPVQPEQLKLVEHFTVATGLPQSVVKALNEFVTLDGSCKRINYLFDHANGRTQPETVAKYNATKPLRDAALARLNVAAAA